MSKYHDIITEWETKALREEQKVVELIADADIDSRMGSIYTAINNEPKDPGACLGIF